MPKINRREAIATGSAALAAYALLHRFAQAFPSRPGESVVPWLDQMAPNPVPDIIQNQLHWEDLDSWNGRDSRRSRQLASVCRQQDNPANFELLAARRE